MKLKEMHRVTCLPIETEPNLEVCLVVNWFKEYETEYFIGRASDVPAKLRTLVKNEIEDLPESDHELFEFLCESPIGNFEYFEIND